MLRSGILYECVQHGVPFVLAGSLRDDGPLPDTITDMNAAQDAYAEQIQGAGSKLLMMTILPFYEPYLLSRHPAEFFQPEGPSGRRKAVNDTIRSVAAAQKAYFFDIGMPLKSWQDRNGRRQPAAQRSQ